MTPTAVVHLDESCRGTGKRGIIPAGAVLMEVRARGKILIGRSITSPPPLPPTFEWP